MKSKRKTSRDIIEKWLNCIVDGKWEDMAKLCQKTWARIYTLEQIIFILECMYKSFDIIKCDIIEENKNAKCLHKYIIKVMTISGEKKIVANVICETAPFKPSLDGKWGVNPDSAVLKKM